MTAQVELLKRPPSNEAIHLLQEWLDDAKEGRVVSVGLVGRSPEGKFRTAHSATENRLEDAAMLITLGLRQLGYEPNR